MEAPGTAGGLESIPWTPLSWGGQGRGPGASLPLWFPTLGNSYLQTVVLGHFYYYF